MAHRVPGLPVHWQQFFCCVALHLALPFLPLALEWMFTKGIEDRSIFLFVAMYSMAIGITSISLLSFCITLVVGLIYCAAYGAAVANAPHVGVFIGWPTTVVLIFIISTHAIERYNRHVVDRSPFFDFMKHADEAPATVVADASGTHH